MALMVFRRHMFSRWPPTAGSRYCAKGTREFFARRGWDWGHFLRHGRPAADFINTRDAMAMKCAENAELEASGGR